MQPDGSRPPAELVIFDCDGVLVDSEALASQLEAEMLTALGATISAADIAEHFTGLSETQMIDKLQREWEITVPATFNADRSRRLTRRFDEALGAVPGIGEVLDQLDRWGTRCCVASSSAPERLAHSLDLVGLTGHFHGHLYSASMVAHGKPAPDLFLHAAAAMGVAPERCVVVEDSVPGVEAGCAAHMEVIGFTAAGHCRPGHGARLRRAGAGEVAATGVELLASLRSRLR